METRPAGYVLSNELSVAILWAFFIQVHEHMRKWSLILIKFSKSTPSHQHLSKQMYRGWSFSHWILSEYVPRFDNIALSNLPCANAERSEGSSSSRSAYLVLWEFTPNQHSIFTYIQSCITIFNHNQSQYIFDVVASIPIISWMML